MYASVVERLLASPEPAIRWQVRTRVLGEPADDLHAEIRDSELVRRLLSHADAPVYAKWQGPHWALGALADLGYPPGDPALHPLRDRILDAWLDESYHHDFEATRKSYGRSGIPVMRGRHRAHASQQGYALWYLITLGLDTPRCDELVQLLLRWQWPDGGWNCDRNPEADTSSFHETLLPMRGLGSYGSPAARSAAEVFLTRRLAYRAGTGEPIHPSFTTLHYPRYWHYDFLGGLRAMAELDLLGDPRCAPALDLLESMRVADGWPARARHYRTSADLALHHDSVDWGGTSTRRASPWVTAEALAVLRAAGRLDSLG